VHPDYGKPGCLWVAAKTHVEGLWGLTDSQAASFGSVFRAMAGSLLKVTDAEKVYIVSIGESLPHFHALLIARTESDSDQRGLPLIGEHLVKGGKGTEAPVHLARLIRELNVVEGIH
jgi:hypothetical protein